MIRWIDILLLTLAVYNTIGFYIGIYLTSGRVLFSSGINAVILWIVLFMITWNKKIDNDLKRIEQSEYDKKYKKIPVNINFKREDGSKVVFRGSKIVKRRVNK